ncbi:NAD-dependent epimerase/dehydratase family protein [Lentisphaera marina]|uniref:NAD-dependent epimerase/dehydratase family protein n=1 Tax=Lentisphaera marina TaxID=1111041 RepID=UPI002365D78D|nr:NAD-dependent epimerase/dehydratase family protein [Lentisphaera marina]MDD7985740.1 NAD-dependent epimerase/dehydratase family protein [Lentisphaera marina]
MKYFITGATGYLGQHLVAALRTKGHEITAVGSKDCDLSHEQRLDKFSETTYDEIIHLAAWTQAGDFCLYHPGEQWLINQRINTNILAWWQGAQPQARLTCMGTSCAYSPDFPLEEKYYMAGEPIDSLYTYAMTKRMLYSGLKALNKQYGLRYMCFVPSTLYGPGYHTDGRQMHFIFDLIRKIIRGKLYGETVTLWGDGHQKRELVYVGDYIRAMCQLMNQCDNQLINIGAGAEHSIREFASLICDKVGYDFDDIQFDTSKYVGAKSKFLDTRKLDETIPDFQRTSLRDGLNMTIDWFIDHKDTIFNNMADS